jgi:hypothetical protein
MKLFLNTRFVTFGVTFRNQYVLFQHQINVLLRAKKVGHQISVSFEKFDVV